MGFPEEDKVYGTKALKNHARSAGMPLRKFARAAVAGSINVKPEIAAAAQQWRLRKREAR